MNKDKLVHEWTPYSPTLPDPSPASHRCINCGLFAIIPAEVSHVWAPPNGRCDHPILMQDVGDGIVILTDHIGGFYAVAIHGKPVHERRKFNE